MCGALHNMIQEQDDEVYHLDDPLDPEVFNCWLHDTSDADDERSSDEDSSDGDNPDPPPQPPKKRRKKRQNPSNNSQPEEEMKTNLKLFNKYYKDNPNLQLDQQK